MIAADMIYDALSIYLGWKCKRCVDCERQKRYGVIATSIPCTGFKRASCRGPAVLIKVDLPLWDTTQPAMHENAQNRSGMTWETLSGHGKEEGGLCGV